MKNVHKRPYHWNDYSNEPYTGKITLILSGTGAKYS